MWPFFSNFGRAVITYNVAKFVIYYDTTKYFRKILRLKLKIRPMNTTINERIKQLIEEKAGGKNTVFAELLGVSEANIRSYTRGVMPKADILEKIVITYDVNAMWLLTGLGYSSLPNQPEDIKAPLTDQSALTDFFRMYEPYIQSKDAKIIQQAEEIGRLREQVAQLKDRLQKSADDASTEATANVG